MCSRCIVRPYFSSKYCIRGYAVPSIIAINSILVSSEGARSLPSSLSKHINKEAKRKERQQTEVHTCLCVNEGFYIMLMDLESGKEGYCLQNL